MGPQSQDLDNSLTEYYRLGVIARNTLNVLARLVKEWNRPSAEQEATLAAALDHLSDVHEGFQLQLRASDVQTLAEMQYLVEQVLVDWRSLEQMHIQVPAPSEIDIPRTQLLAFAHAYLSMAMLPRMPKTHITFPSTLASYADIPIPTSGAELWDRLEELERVIYRVLGGARDRVKGEPLRRTYGFFESSAWLITRHHKRFVSA